LVAGEKHPDRDLDGMYRAANIHRLTADELYPDGDIDEAATPRERLRQSIRQTHIVSADLVQSAAVYSA
jgi:hypothetical protein